MTQAVLIDGEAVPPALADAIRRRFPGPCAVRRVYGHSAALEGWSAVDWANLRHVARGRSGSAFAIAVDALTLAHGGRATGFVLVGFEADSGWLVSHLRAQGCDVEVLSPGALSALARVGTRRLRAGETIGTLTRLVAVDAAKAAAGAGGAAGGAAAPRGDAGAESAPGAVTPIAARLSRKA